MQVIVGGQVWLPRGSLSDLNVLNIKRQLTILPRKTTDIQAKKDPDPIFLYEEDEERDLIGVPRGYYLEKTRGNNEEILEVSLGAPMRDLSNHRFKAVGPYAEQAVALEVLQDEIKDKPWGGVFLRGAPAFGKTIAGLEFARRLGRRTLIMVHKDFLVRQWRKRINWLMPDARVGIIRQEVCEYDEIRETGEAPDFVIAINQSLAKDSGFKYPVEMYTSFGLLIVDEVHRVGAATWAGLPPRFNAAYRLGLSATVKRKDGADDVFNYHISRVTYSAHTKMVRPKIRKIITTSTLKPIRRGDYVVAEQNLNSAQVLNQLCADDFRSKEIVDDIALGVKAGRKILVISERLSHLKKMAEYLGAVLFDTKLDFVPRIDFYTGAWYTGDVWDSTKRGKKGNILHRKGDPKTRTRTEQELDRAEEANVIFATKQIIEEGFDCSALDVLVMATPMSDIEQMIGRIRRWCVSESADCGRLCPWRAGRCKAKPQPIIVEVIDMEIPQLQRKWKKRKAFYKRAGIL